MQASDKAKSLPILAVPGWLEKDRLPNAVAVIRALKSTRVTLTNLGFHVGNPENENPSGQ